MSQALSQVVTEIWEPPNWFHTDPVLLQTKVWLQASSSVCSCDTAPDQSQTETCEALRRALQQTRTRGLRCLQELEQASAWAEAQHDSEDEHRDHEHTPVSWTTSELETLSQALAEACCEELRLLEGLETQASQRGSTTPDLADVERALQSFHTRFEQLVTQSEDREWSHQLAVAQQDADTAEAQLANARIVLAQFT